MYHLYLLNPQKYSPANLSFEAYGLIWDSKLNLATEIVVECNLQNTQHSAEIIAI